MNNLTVVFKKAIVCYNLNDNLNSRFLQVLSADAFAAFEEKGLNNRDDVVLLGNRYDSHQISFNILLFSRLGNRNEM